MQVTEIDSYKPNWGNACRNCSETPSVDAVKNGVTVLRTGLCGPCCWGDANAIDPDTWNTN